MKTTVDIPDGELEDVIRYTNARTKREAIVSADSITPQELQAARRRD